MLKTHPQSICLLRLSAIGDTCNVVPVLLQLQNAFPETKITWVIGRVEHSLLQSLPGVEFIIVDKSAGKKGVLAAKKQLQQRSFDVLLHMHASMRANLISRHIKADRKIGFDRARAKDFHYYFCQEHVRSSKHSHVVDGFLDFLEALGVQRQPPTWSIPVTPEASSYADQIVQSSTLVISPCSSDRRKNFRNWSIANYQRMVNHAIEQHQLNVVLTGGNSPLERQYGEALESGSQYPITNLIGQTTLQQLMAILARADVVVCPDSGPGHMANAVNTPVIGLFATSNRLRTGPYNSQRWIVDRYPDAVKTYLKKSVEDVSWGQRVRAAEAMNLITLEDVTTTLDKLMQAKT